MIEPRKLDSEEFWIATKRFYWSMVMSSMRWKGRSFKHHESVIVDAAQAALSDHEREVLSYQLSRPISVERFARGRFIRLHTDRRYPAPFDNGAGKQPLATVTARQGKLHFKAVIETWDGHLWGITFSGGKFDPKQPFDILKTERGGSQSRLAAAMDRYEHGRDERGESRS